MASLNSVKQKVLWARENLKLLETEGQRYFASEPGKTVPEQEQNTGRLILKFDARTPIPTNIPFMVGDTLQNLRSSLDYLVWELVLAANNIPTHKNMFPICDRLEAFEGQLKRGRLNGVSAEATAEIERLQPYSSGQLVKNNLLSTLDLFCNINKHRRVLLTTLVASQSKTEIIGSESGHSIQQTTTPRHHGAEIAVGPIPTKVGEIVEMKGKMFTSITFDEGPCKGENIGTFLQTLGYFLETKVIPKFERFFV